jgi:hypothetical protein
MGRGKIHIIPEQVDTVTLVLPRDVKLVGGELVGGAIEFDLEGPEIEDGASYQVVVIEEPLSRTIRLQKSEQDIGTFIERGDRRTARLIEENERLRAEVAKVDGDGDGKVGGSKPKKAKPGA